MRFLSLLTVALAACCLADNDVRGLERSLAMQTAEANAKNTWVVLVAGSTSYSNYRHQASVCHAYQVAHRYGVPDEHIIVFMADDIAYNRQNPFPGAVYNYFYIKGGNNVNVYEGVPKDYTEKNATADNLVAVLTGRTPKTGSGKTLQSTAADNVFFYYDDHGNSDIIAMPYGRYFTGTKDMKEVLETMSTKRMFKNLVMFVQACYSGSMFYKQDLPANVYIATSAPADASAYACWMDSTLRTFVTSCWPRGWLHPMDEVSPATLTFDRLFADAHDFTRNSTEPCQYGDTEVKKLTMSEFFGAPATLTGPLAGQTRDLRLEANSVNVPQYDVPLFLARYRYQETHSEEDAAALRQELAYRDHIDSVVRAVADAAIPGYSGLLGSTVCTKGCDASCDCYNTCMLSGSQETCKLHCCGYANCFPRTKQEDKSLECARTLVHAFVNTCGRSNHDYILSATESFQRICRTPNVDVASALAAIDQLC